MIKFPPILLVPSVIKNIVMIVVNLVAGVESQCAAIVLTMLKIILKGKVTWISYAAQSVQLNVVPVIFHTQKLMYFINAKDANKKFVMIANYLVLTVKGKITAWNASIIVMFVIKEYVLLVKSNALNAKKQYVKGVVQCHVKIARL